MGILLFVLFFLKSKYLLTNLRVEYYTSSIALLFIGLGLWAGRTYYKKKESRQDIIQRPLDFEQIIARYNISKREAEVLALLLEGKSNKEIADQLYVSLNTIKTHVSKLLSKTGLERRTQLIRLVKGQ